MESEKSKCPTVGQQRQRAFQSYIGIDPGANGGVAVLMEHNNAGIVTYNADKMPRTERGIFSLIERIKNVNNPVFAVIEKVHSSPQMGVKSSFTFGQNKGMLLMALTACAIPFEEVSPQMWQKYMGCLTKGDKNVTKRKAEQLFPNMKITHAIADSLLIAEFCRRKMS